MSSIWFLCQTQQSKKEKRKKKNLILNNTKTWIEAIWETQQRKKIMRGKKVTVVGFGSEVAIGAKGEAFSGFDQKLLPHLCDLRCSSVLMQREKGFRVLRVASFKFQNAQDTWTALGNELMGLRKKVENGELANSARQSIRGATDSKVEDTWTAQGNEFMVLRKKVENVK